MKWIGQHIYDLAARFRGDVTIEGDLTVNGTYTQIDTDVTTTEQWLVTNDGTGPAAIINQKGSQDIFDVQDDGTSVFYIEDGGNVGIGTTSPGSKLEVAGSAEFIGSNVSLKLNTTSSDASLMFEQSGANKWSVRSDGSGTMSANSLVFTNANLGSEVLILDQTNGHVIMPTGNVGIGTTSPTQALHLPDSKQIALGTGADLKIQHNGTNSEIGNSTGQLNIYNHADNSDINFMADDGSGGIETYFFLDGSTGVTTFPDDKRLTFGTDLDLFLYHTGGTMNMKNYTGNMTFTNNANDKDIIFQSDDGSGGVKSYFYLDGSVGATVFPDSSKLYFGTSHDAYIEHDGTNTYLSNNAGSLIIRTTTDDADVILQSDDGSGGVTAYLTLDGSATRITSHVDFDFADHAVFANNTELRWKDSGGTERTTLELTSADDLYFGGSFSGSTIFVGGGSYTERMRIDDSGGVLLSSTLTVGVDSTGHDVRFYGATSGRFLMWDESADSLEFRDSVKATFGNSADLQIYHDGTYNVIKAMSGHMLIKQDSDDQDIIFQCDDGSGGTTEYFRLDGGLSSPYTVFPDNSTLTIGTGFDLKMYHNGSNSYIDQTGTGNLYIRNTTDDADIIFQSDDGSGGTTNYFVVDGSAEQTRFYKDTRHTDGIKANFGNADDLSIHHDGSNSLIDNITGHLYIYQKADDKNIIFMCDDGSGGNTAYLTLDGSASRTKFAVDTFHSDGVAARFGNGEDLRIYHNGSHSNIESNGVGDLYIMQKNDDKDIIFQSDDGSGGVQTYLTIDGGVEAVIAPDTIYLAVGTDMDLSMRHNGSDSYLHNNTGDFYIRNGADDKDLILQCDDGSGGTTAYLTLDGSAETVVVDKPLLINGAAIKASPNLYDNIIKLLPSDFVTNDHAGVTKFGIGYVDTAGTTYGMKPTNADTELYTFVSIPQGMKATHVDVFDKYNKGVIVYEAQINATTLTSKGTGNCNTQIDITDVNATATNFLAIQVTTTATSDRVFGGQVTIAAI